MDGLASTFPPPPFYYHSFTEDNVKLVKSKLLDEQEILEEPLNYLVPPLPTEDKTYRGFGSIWNTQEKLAPLEDMGVTRLYGDHGEDYRQLLVELKKLLRSALVNFVALTGTMSVNPESFLGIIENMRVIFINMHHLLNLYRPHQTRESIIYLMQDQIDETRRKTDAMRDSNEEIASRISRYAETLVRMKKPVVDHESCDLGEWKGLNLSIDAQPLEALEEGDEDDMVVD